MSIYFTHPGAPDFDQFLKAGTWATVPPFPYEPAIPTAHLRQCWFFEKEGQPLGRIALYVNEQLGEDGFLLGGYACCEDEEVSQNLLEVAVNAARQLGASRVWGPMNGSTWHSYRFPATAQPRPFLLEPYLPTYFMEQWTHYGFEKAQLYESRQALIDPAMVAPKAAILADLQAQGLEIRAYRPDPDQQDLRQLAQLSFLAFKDNFLYSPQSEQAFVEQMAPLEPLLDPGLLLLAFDGPNLVGFIFGLPDRLDPKNETMIIKTLARAPGPAYEGLGRRLFHYLIHLSFEKGYRKMIHALMKSDNVSTRISAEKEGSLYRHYWLLKMHL